ncbi:MAG: hypothetical protein ACRC1P_09665 [Cellulosilyticaceae bacterium]
MDYRLKGEEATEFGVDFVVFESDHKEVIDDIENKVSDALREIENIEGIDKIDNCKQVLQELLSKLY